MFRNELAFLSNFYPSEIVFNSITFPTAEHLYQWTKAGNAKSKELVLAQNTPGKAKRITRDPRFIVRADWRLVNLKCMEQILRLKFRGRLLAMLLVTGDQELVEENAWGDTFWGVCQGEGENNLGKILMKIRDENKRS